MDFIDAADGPLMIDINPRFLGAWVALQSVGVDILGAYEAALCGRVFRPQRTPTPPDDPIPALRGGDGVSGLWRRNRRLRRQLTPTLGRRWAAVEAASGMVAVARKRYRAG